MNKKSDDELGILLTREIQSMMFNDKLTAEQRVSIFCSVVSGEEVDDPLLSAFAETLKTGFIHANEARKASIYSKRERERERLRNQRQSSAINANQRQSSATAIYGNGNGNGNGNGKVPPKSPEGLKGESSSSSEPVSMLDNPAAALGLPDGQNSANDGRAHDGDEAAKIAAEIEGGYPYKVNRGKLRKCLKSVLKKNSAAEVLGGYRRWLAVWQADDFQWAPSRITDWLYDAKFLEKPRRGNTRAAPQVDPDTVSSDAHLDLV